MRWLVCLAALFCACLPCGAEERIAEIRVWKGNGCVRTALFRVAGAEWAVRHRHEGGGLFQVRVFDGDGNLLDVPVTSDKAEAGRAAVAGGAGVRYLAVTADGAWSLAVEQPMTAVEELALRREMRQEAALPPPKRAEWGREAGRFTHRFALPPGHWRLACRSLGAGRAEFVAKTDGPDGLVLAASAAGREAAEGWFHGGGTLTVEVSAPDAPWRFEVCGTPEPPKAERTKKADEPETIDAPAVPADGTAEKTAEKEKAAEHDNDSPKAGGADDRRE